MEKNQALATIPKKTTDAISTNLSKVQWILPKDITLDRFRAGLWLQFSLQDRLKDCTPNSIVRAIVKAAQKGLEPGRDCCFLPFKNRKGNYYEAQMIEEYQGVLRCLDRTGRVAWAKAEPVFQRDHFICDELAEVYEFRRHLGGDRGHLVCYFSAIKLYSYDKPLVRVCSIEEVDEVKTKMGRQEYEAWVKWPHEMGKKTAIKKHAKMLNLVDDDGEDEPPVISDEQFRDNVNDLYGDDMSRRIPDMTAIKGSPSDERGIPSPEIPDRGVGNAPETNLEGMDWREPLSAGLAALDEIIKDEGEGSKTAKHLGATLQEAADMLQTADVPGEEGQAMLQRIRAEVAALTGQDSFAL